MFWDSKLSYDNKNIEKKVAQRNCCFRHSTSYFFSGASVCPSFFLTNRAMSTLCICFSQGGSFVDQSPNTPTLKERLHAM